MSKIRPSADLRNKYNELATYCKESNEAVYITVNGRDDTVLLSVAEYNQMVAELTLLRELAEAEADVKNNRLSEFNGFDDLRKKILERKA